MRSYPAPAPPLAERTAAPEPQHAGIVAAGAPYNEQLADVAATQLTARAELYGAIGAHDAAGHAHNRKDDNDDRNGEIGVPNYYPHHPYADPRPQPTAKPTPKPGNCYTPITTSTVVCSDLIAGICLSISCTETETTTLSVSCVDTKAGTVTRSECLKCVSGCLTITNTSTQVGPTPSKMRSCYTPTVTSTRVCPHLIAEFCLAQPACLIQTSTTLSVDCIDRAAATVTEVECEKCRVGCNRITQTITQVGHKETKKCKGQAHEY